MVEQTGKSVFESARVKMYTWDCSLDTLPRAPLWSGGKMLNSRIVMACCHARHATGGALIDK